MDWNKVRDQGAIDRTIAGLRARGFNPVLVENRGEALKKLQQMIPAGAEIMTGSSTTLIEIGFVDLLKDGKHPWRNWKDRILAEKDQAKQMDLRRASTTAEYFIGSVQAITETGQVLGADASGSRQGGYVFAAKHVLWVVGVNKIVLDLDMAFRRLHEYAVPLEDARMKKTGSQGTYIGKMVVYEREATADRISTILINERLGY
jgi:hypothetical protein